MRLVRALTLEDLEKMKEEWERSNPPHIPSWHDFLEVEKPTFRPTEWEDIFLRRLKEPYHSCVWWYRASDP
jgi:hypothetical protein